MGAADTVPGVSGGTIALVVGVYERLITALTTAPSALQEFRDIQTADGRTKAAEALLRADVPFLLVLGAGILSAAATVATGMNIAVTRYPAPTYAFFFGLIAASAVVLFQYVTVGTYRRLLVGAIGFALAFAVTDPALALTRTTTLPALFLAGAIAISAMVLPGISGAFLLLVMGQYEYVSGIPRSVFEGAVAALGGNFDSLFDALIPFAVFLMGAFVGLFSVAYAVRAALDRYRQETLIFLVSLMVGALRLPVNRVADGIATVSPGSVVSVVVPLLGGAFAVFVLDRYTDDLQY